MTNEKIQEADETAQKESTEWASFSQDKKATNMYTIMLNDNGKSALKSITAQCLASMLRWECIENPPEDEKEKMFDVDLFQFKVSDKKIGTLKEKIEADESIRYIVSAIKHAVGAES